MQKYKVLFLSALVSFFLFSCSFWGLNDNIIISKKNGLFDFHDSVLYLHGDYLLITNPMDVAIGPSDGLVIADISDPKGVIYKGSVPDTGGLACKDNTLYSYKDRVLKIIDISNVENPVEVDAIELSISGWEDGIAINGNFLYCGGLITLDISDPQNPVVVNITEFGDYSRIIIEGETAYCFTYTSIPVLTLIDISDPVNPEHLRDVTLLENSNINKSVVHNSMVFIPFENMVSGFFVLDVSDPEQIRISDKIEISRIYDFTVYDDILYAASGQWAIYPRIARYSLEDPFNPRRLYSTGTVPEDNLSIRCNEDYMYVLTEDAIFVCVRQENTL